MQYESGRIGRVVVARFDHEEDVLSSLSGLCEKESIHSGWFFLFGALARGEIVVGPQEDTLPPVPVKREFEGPYEVIGTGSVALDGENVSLHLHSTLGSKGDVLAGCIRGKGEVYIVIECLVLEVEGLSMRRTLDPVTGLKLLGLSRER